MSSRTCPDWPRLMEIAPEFVAVALERLAGMGLAARLAEPDS